MPLEHTTFRHEFGLALHENGLNKISDALRRNKPELFSKITDIPIKPEDTSPAHILTLYAMVNDPLMFDIHPIHESIVGINHLKISADISFSLTDNQLGLITRIGIKVESICEIIRKDRVLDINIVEFKIVDIRGEHPDFGVLLVNGALDASVAVSNKLEVSSIANDDLKETFLALLNYLIEIFLKDALNKVVKEFPIPDLSKVIDFGPLEFGNNEYHGPFLRNNTLYITLGKDLGGPSDFPVETSLRPKPDISVGISESGLQRILDAFLPVPINIVPEDPNKWFTVWSNNLKLHKVQFDIRVNNNPILMKAFIVGDIIFRLRFHVPVINRDIELGIPLLLNELTNYYGEARPYLEIGNPNIPNAEVILRLDPASDFLEKWYAVIVTDYRRIIESLVRRAIDGIRDSLVIRIFRKIPILGWILDRVLDGAEWVISNMLAPIVDVFISYALTIIVNTIGRVILTLIKDPQIKIFKIQQSKISNLLSVGISNGIVRAIENGKGDELEIDLWLEKVDSTLVNVDNVRLLSTDQQPNAPVSRLSSLREYNFEGGFLEFEAPDFKEGLYQYSFTATIDNTLLTGTLSLSITKLNDTYVLEKNLISDQVNVVQKTTVTYKEGSKDPNTLEHTSLMSGEHSYFHKADFQFESNKIKVSSVVTGAPPSEILLTKVMDSIHETEEFWMFRLSFTSILPNQTGIFPRLEIRSSYEYENWARLIPIAIKEIKEIQIPKPGNPQENIKALKILAEDEESQWELFIDTLNKGLISAKCTQDGAVIELERLF